MNENSNLFFDLISRFQSDYQDLWLWFQEHILLVFISMSIAILISVPLGIALTNMRKYAEPIIGLAAVLQTIPSLAMLAFLMVYTGIGTLPAIIALGAYALLPILRNTYTGITEVEQSAVEAGRGMGMTRGQILRKIELPLAMPVIMAGIRTSTVINIGVATLATFVGAGGLGVPIMRGLRTNTEELILMGAITAAVLALVVDFILKQIEKKVTPKGVSNS